MLYQSEDTKVEFIVSAHLKDKIPEGTNQVKVTEVAPVLAVNPNERLLELRVADPLATTKAIVLRETIMSEYGAISPYETLIGTEENPKEHSAVATF